MKRPIEHEYNSFVSYARELEKYCDWQESEIEQIEATARIRRVRNEVLEAELTTLRTAAQQALNALKGWPGKPRAAFEILTAALESKT